jgi:hypothetical protein
MCVIGLQLLTSVVVLGLSPAASWCASSAPLWTPLLGCDTVVAVTSGYGSCTECLTIEDCRQSGHASN